MLPPWTKGRSLRDGRSRSAPAAPIATFSFDDGLLRVLIFMTLAEGEAPGSLEGATPPAV